MKKDKKLNVDLAKVSKETRAFVEKCANNFQPVLRIGDNGKPVWLVYDLIQAEDPDPAHTIDGPRVMFSPRLATETEEKELNSANKLNTKSSERELASAGIASLHRSKGLARKAV